MCAQNMKISGSVSGSGTPPPPITVTEESWENQRWRFRTQDFCSRLLPTDRFPFSNEDGTESRDKTEIELPSHVWRWVGDWEIESSFQGDDLEEDGWTYALDFRQHFTATRKSTSWVRRRKWVRVREYVPSNPSLCSLPHDHDQFIYSDNNYTSDNVSCNWAIGPNGEIYFHQSVKSCQPGGCEWTSSKTTKVIPDACQIAVSGNGIPFIVTKSGGLLFRTGISPVNLPGSQWHSCSSPSPSSSGGIQQISVGKDTLWVITAEHECFTLHGKISDLLARADDTRNNRDAPPTSTSPNPNNSTIINSIIEETDDIDDAGTDVVDSIAYKPIVESESDFQKLDFEWIEIPGKMKAISVSKNDLVILASGFGRENDVVFYRTEVTRKNPIGRDWKEVSEFYDKNVHLNLDLHFDSKLQL